MTIKSNLDEAELRKNVHIKRSSDLEWIMSVKSYPEPVVEKSSALRQRGSPWWIMVKGSTGETALWLSFEVSAGSC